LVQTNTRIFEARRILTMDPNRPDATHVAVRDGRILGVGTLDSLGGWGDAERDRSFSDKILMPGLVEGHSHVLEGWVWNHAYLGSYDRRAPDGVVWEGVTSIEGVVARLREAAGRRGGEGPLTGWGFDPLFVERRLTAADLDRVSSERPVIVYHASFHIVVVNSLVLRRAGLSDETNSEFVLRGDDGRITGELAGQVGRYLMAKALGVEGSGLPVASIDDLRRFAASAQAAGVTTATDLHNDLPEATVETYRRAAAEADFPIRVVPALQGAAPRDDAVRYLQSLVAGNTDKLRFGLVKFVADGSIQGFTARLKWPGYYNGRPNGLWYIAPDELKQKLKAFHEAGFQVHIHTNGDMATELALDTIEAVLTEAPRPDHRHTLQHCQMADAAQFRRMAALGICVNLFANHIYYWGDAHYALTMGPDRAERMDGCGTAVRSGVPFAIHSDAPITPIGPLFTAWCAVNRLTSSGRLLGAGERISVQQALRAITLGAAYTLKMDDAIGSIEVGKFADFAVLEDDPLEVPPEALKDVRIWGTVVGGQVFPVPTAT
jgi:predicted amidohydrolase YtcJ